MLGIFHDEDVREAVADRIVDVELFTPAAGAAAVSEGGVRSERETLTGRFAIYAAPGSGRRDPAGALLREEAERWLGRGVTADPVAPGSPTAGHARPSTRSP